MKHIHNSLNVSGASSVVFHADPQPYPAPLPGDSILGIRTAQIARYDLCLTDPQFNSLNGSRHEASSRIARLNGWLSQLDAIFNNFIASLPEPVEAVLIPCPISAAREFIAERARLMHLPVVAQNSGPMKGFVFIERDETGPRSRLSTSIFWRRVQMISFDDGEKRAFEALRHNWLMQRETRGPLGATEMPGSPAEEPEAEPDVIPSGCCLIIGQDPTDANQIIHLGSVGYDPLAVVKLALAQYDGPVVFRPHPFDFQSHREIAAAGAMVTRNCHIHDALASAERIVTWNSNAGLEALFFHKPLAVLSQALYRHPELATLVYSYRDLEPFFARKTITDAGIIDHFLRFLFIRFLTPDRPDAIRARVIEEARYHC